MIAIGAQTCPQALRLLRRDCMSEHLLNPDGRVVVSWHKGRSNREQRQFARSELLGPVIRSTGGWR